MCGIAGVFRLTGSVTAEDLGAVLRMLDVQVHRGPDDWGLLVPDGTPDDVRAQLARLDPAHVSTYRAVPGTPTIVLGSRRLSIIDRSPRGRMPMGTHDRRRWIVQNGEIYNYRELRAELDGAAGAFCSATDTEVLLRGWDAWGDAVPERLRGMFAFALFEAAPRPRLLLGRDRFGIKPLYFHEDRARVVFASEVRAIVASGLVPDEPNPEALARFLELGSVPVPLTTVKDVRALPAGRVAHVDAGGLRLARYWSLDAAVGAARPPAPPSRAEAVASTRALLEESVRLHLVGDAPLGVFLSGGVDSAGLVALAAGGQRPLTTLTVTFDEPGFSEARYARLVAERFGTDHHEVVVRANAVFDELPRFFAAMDQPTVDGLNTWCVSRAAREAGLTVVLSGLGADEVFWGYRHLRSVAALGGARRLMAALPRPARRGLARLAAACAGRRRAGLDRVAYLETPSAAGIYLLIRGLFTSAQTRGLLGLEAGELGDARTALPQEGGRGLRDALTRFDIGHYLGDQVLRDADVMGMAHSVEARVPYLDHRLVEHVLALPPALKLDRVRPKPLLLDALGDRLPREVWDRPKMGFTFPMASWMRERAGELERLCLEDKRLQRPAVEAVWRAFRQGRAHWSRPWALVTLSRSDGHLKGPSRCVR